MNQNENLFENENNTENIFPINQDPVDEVPAPESAEETDATEQTEETPPYIPPHDDGWQPYYPAGTYANKWESNKNGKKKNGKKLLVFSLVTASVIIFILACLCGLLILKEIKLPEGFWDETSQQTPGGGNNSQGGGETSAPAKEPPASVDNPELNLNITDHEQISTVYTQLYAKCSQSCVTIICTQKKSSGYTLGSGFVLSEDGYIATNHHVIEDADDITVQFYDGTKYKAKLIGSDSITDLAVLRIDASGLVPAELGDSKKVSVGETVFAIGTPYDVTLEGTMTLGVVSGLARNVECTDDYGNVVKTMTLIQTDASINPGNSGGPLFNMNGQVIGINTLKLMNEYEGLGFSIPISDAIQVFEILVEYGELPDYGDTDFVKTTPKLYITVVAVSDARNSAEYGRYLSKDAPDGLYILNVTPGTAIYEAGLEMYDIITEFNGVAVESRADLAAELAKCSAGQQVTIKVYHRGEYKTLTFKLDKAE